MLDERTISVVKSTAPILDEHGETLTCHFYRRLFEHNPEVLPLFNPANQQGGSQQKALAAAICAYAANIDNLEVLGGAVELIAQKHASLQVKPEHYPIIGANLLASIREVMGEGATDEVVDAWGKAYGFLAGIMTGREAEIYREQKAVPGGWVGFRSFTVLRKEKESEVITSFYLKPADGGALAPFAAGQYITVRVPLPNGRTTMRNYSLSDRPGRDWYRISVKREGGADTPQGYVSHFLHGSVEEGMTLELGPPCGEFTLDVTERHERPLVLLAAGVGVTPIMSMLQTALEAMPGREIVFIHACLNERLRAFAGAVDALKARHPNLTVHVRYSAPDSPVTQEGISTGFVDAELIERFVPERDADYYFCGPRPFMTGVYGDLLAWGIPPAQVHFEFFGPASELKG
jgi:nitric oxide dioxygenase